MKSTFNARSQPVPYNDMGLSPHSMRSPPSFNSSAQQANYAQGDAVFLCLHMFILSLSEALDFEWNLYLPHVMCLTFLFHSHPASLNQPNAYRSSRYQGSGDNDRGRVFGAAVDTISRSR